MCCSFCPLDLFDMRTDRSFLRDNAAGNEEDTFLATINNSCAFTL